MRPGQDDIEMACSSVIYKRGKLRDTILQFWLFFFSTLYISFSFAWSFDCVARSSSIRQSMN